MSNLSESLYASVRKGGLNRGRSMPSPLEKHFEEYQTYTVPRGSGRGKRIVRVYTGMYYTRTLAPLKEAGARALSALCGLGAAWFFALGATRDCAFNSHWWAGLSQAVCVPLLFWLLIALAQRALAPQRLTAGEYRAACVALRRASLCSAAALGAYALMALGYAAVHGSASLYSAGHAAAAAALAMGVRHVEGRWPYSKVPSPHKPPDGGVCISRETKEEE